MNLPLHKSGIQQFSVQKSSESTGKFHICNEDTLIPVMKTGLSLWEKLHRENPVFITGIVLQWMNYCSKHWQSQNNQTLINQPPEYSLDYHSISSLVWIIIYILYYCYIFYCRNILELNRTLWMAKLRTYNDSSKQICQIIFKQKDWNVWIYH